MKHIFFKILKVSVKFYRQQNFYLLCVLLIIAVHCWIFLSANKCAECFSFLHLQNYFDAIQIHVYFNLCLLAIILLLPGFDGTPRPVLVITISFRLVSKGLEFFLTLMFIISQKLVGKKLD